MRGNDRHQTEKNRGGGPLQARCAVFVLSRFLVLIDSVNAARKWGKGEDFAQLGLGNRYKGAALLEKRISHK